MIRRFVLLCCFTGLYSSANAQVAIELDLDGTLGNGPDTMAVSVGDTVNIDLWFLGDGIFTGHIVDVCGLDTADVIEVVHCTGFEIDSDQYIGATCTRISGVAFTFFAFLPSKVATLSFESGCPGSGGLIEALIDSALVIDDALQSIEVTSTTPAYIAVDCDTATESASWSDVKTLFR